MKKKRIMIILFLLLLAAGGAAWYCCRSESDEVKIARNLEELCRICGKSRGENGAVLALRVNRGVEKLFARVCMLRFRIGYFDGKSNPTRLAADIVRVQHLFEELKFSVSDIQTAIDETGRAVVQFSGSVRGKGRNGRMLDEIRDIEAVLKQDETKSWKIHSMTFHEILER